MASLLNDEIKEQLQEFFSGLKNPIQVVFFGDKQNNCEYCEDTLELLEEVASLDERISVQAYDLLENSDVAEKYHIDKVPSFAILARSGDEWLDYGIRFAGIPAGHEFTSLINDILIVSKGESGLSANTREALGKIDTPITMQVFITPTCPYCPRAVVLAHQMAMESPFIQAEMVEAMEFSQLANQYRVSGVPHTIINAGAGEIVGAVPEGQLLQKIQEVLSLKKIGEVN